MEGFECQSCGARLELAPEQRTGRCLYCASPQVIERPPEADRPNPTFVLPFEVQPERALTAARKWVRGSLWAPRAFRQAKVEDVRGVYLPAYLYTAALSAEYSVQIGEEYTVSEKGSDGKTKTRTKTEWCNLKGKFAAWSDDEVVTASRGVDNHVLEGVEPFALDRLRRYAPELVSGWATEEPSISASTCRQLAHKEMQGQAERRIASFLPGDRHRNLKHRLWVDEEDLEPLLLPLWVLPVRYGKKEKLVRLLVNGESGKVAGKRPLSWWKVSLAVLGVLAALAAIGIGLGLAEGTL